LGIWQGGLAAKGSADLQTKADHPLWPLTNLCSKLAAKVW
jgi:hypothetical protein